MKPSAHERIKALLIFSLKLIVALLVFSVLAGILALGVYYLWVGVGWAGFFWVLLIFLVVFGLYFLIGIVAVVDALVGWVGGKEWRERRDQKFNQRIEQRMQRLEQRREESRQRYERYRPVRSRKYERRRPVRGQRAERGIEYDRYMNSEAWREKAEAAKKRVGYRCQLCNKRTGLQAHHPTYASLGKELPGDLTVLCAGCHSKFHDKLSKRRRRTAGRR